MGIFGMVLGFLKLGFLLEFISIPIITGFISAVAITILLNQMGSLLGSDVSSDGAASQIHDVFANLGGASGLTCAIGFSCIAFLTILDKAGKRWGDKNKVVWLLSILRAFLALVLYTGISYAVNHNLGEDDYLFKVVKVKSNGLETPQIPSMDLVSQTFSKSITVFVGAAIEHTAIARAFGVRNDYIPDQSQELCYFGVCNVSGCSYFPKTLKLEDWSFSSGLFWCCAIAESAPFSSFSTAFSTPWVSAAPCRGHQSILPAKSSRHYQALSQPPSSWYPSIS